MPEHGSEWFGSEIKYLIERTAAVPKAAFSKPADRPTVQQHFATLACTKEMELVASILVVDDVVTSGSMLLATVSRLTETYPAAEIRAFALIRTMSGQEIESIKNPCKGTISLRGERSSRFP
jgi:predicted amidophosphoribosyltransferase